MNKAMLSHCVLITYIQSSSVKMLAVNSAVYSLDCQGQLDSVVAFDYTVHAFLRDSRQTISQKVSLLYIYTQL